MRIRKKTKRKIKKVLFVLFIALLISILNGEDGKIFNLKSFAIPTYSIGEVPEYEGNAYVIIDDNIPSFKEEEITTDTFEKYSRLDYFGRCGVAFANVSKDTMPTTERGKIGMIKPSGWKNTKYDFIDGKYLYNRCHLIGYQLTGENANERNLITCTRFMNASTMLEFENKVAKYVKNTNNHVLYRVTPIFKGTNLLASGVQMEALSVEDNGKGIKFNVYVYNIQKGVNIDYRTGDSSLINE